MYKHIIMFCLIMGQAGIGIVHGEYLVEKARPGGDVPERTIQAKDIMRDIRSDMTNAELMEAYRLTTEDLEKVFKQLISSGAMTVPEIYGGPSVNIAYEDKAELSEAWLPQFRISYGESATFLDYNYISQVGESGFFGPYDVDNSATGALAPVNGWVSTSQIVSGASSAQASLTALVKPLLSLTSAVSVTSAYRIGPYPIATAPGSASLSTGNWIWWTIEVQTPWGLIYYGKRRFSYGMGLQLRGARTEELLGLEAPILGYPELDKEKKSELDGWTAATSGTAVSPKLIVGLGIYPFRRGSAQDRDPSDLNSARSANLAAYLTYSDRYVESQIGTLYSVFREGPESQRTALARSQFPPTDTSSSEGWIFLKYRNAWFSVGSELDWYYRTVRHQRSLDGTFNGIPDNTDGSGSLFAPQYIQSWRFGTQIITARGPLMLRLLYSYMPGPDRRHGVLIDRQPFIQEPDQSGVTFFSKHNAILGATYSGGVNGFSDIPGASVYGARVDYSLAANLQLYSRILTARRTSHGYGWGFIRPDLDPARYGQVNYGIRGSFADPAPAIPNDDLGWEVGVGFSWELLANWYVDLDVNYWKPGRWFNFACIDRSVPNWITPSGSNRFGINPDRKIDPMLAVNIEVRGEF